MQQKCDKEIEIAKKEATSFPGLVPPDNAKYIGSERTKNDSYDYFKTQDGKYYYQSDSTRLLEEQYQLKQKEKKKSSKIAALLFP